MEQNLLGKERAQKKFQKEYSQVNFCCVQPLQNYFQYFFTENVVFAKGALPLSNGM